ncbi:hypothetical protein OKW45_002986 [Paraburkholderia sp. WSM4175]
MRILNSKSSSSRRKLLDTAVVTVAAPSYIARRGRPAKPEDLEGPSHRCLESVIRRQERGAVDQSLSRLA